MRKKLEIEHKLKITVFLPQICFFCGEEITKKHGCDFNSLTFHSLDEDHDNWDPDNKVPAHHGCHSSFHQKGKLHPWMAGDKNPSKRPDQRQRMREDNPMHRPEVAAKVSERMKMYSPMKDPKVAAKQGMSMRGEKAIERNRKGWITRRDRYGPSGTRPKKVLGVAP